LSNDETDAKAVAKAKYYFSYCFTHVPARGRRRHRYQRLMENHAKRAIPAARRSRAMRSMSNICASAT
jgi:hypothetical protein